MGKVVTLLLVISGYLYAARLSTLDDQCYDTLKKGYRPGTLKNIRSQALIYSRFCEFYGLNRFPASEWQMVRYARYIANTVVSYETVINYLAGVRTLHRLGGYALPDLRESPNLIHILRAIKFELAHPIKQAEPVTPELLRELYDFIDLSSLRDIVCFTALLLGFYMFLRKSNLVPDTLQGFNPSEQLIRSDIRIGNGLVLVEIKWSKTLQYREKILLLPLIPASDKRICPVFWLQLMLGKIQASPADPLLAVPGPAGLQPVTYAQLGERLKQLVAATGRPAERYTLHGLRRGGTCHALESGLVGEDLKIMGDWASDAYMTYIDQTVQRRVRNMVQFMQGL